MLAGGGCGFCTSTTSHAVASNRYLVRLQQTQRCQCAGDTGLAVFLAVLQSCIVTLSKGGTSTHAHIDAWAMAAHSAGAPWAMPLSPRLVHRLDKGRSLTMHPTCLHTVFSI